MKKLSEMFKKLWAKFKSFSKKIKIAIIASVIAVIVAIVTLIVFATSTKYAPLYSNLEASDSDAILAQLKQDGVKYKIEGDTIEVPEEQVSELRMSLASKLSDNSKGYELMDSESSFGMTDEEFNLKKVRIIQGELEKAIKSLDPVESAKVLITPAESSVFAKESKEGSASVVVKLKTGKTLEKAQVESIVAIVSASTKNIPKKNVEVVDTNMNLLSKNINSEDSTTGVNSDEISSQKQLENKKAEEYKNSIVNHLEDILGKDKVSASVNVEMNFDAQQTEEKTVDPNKVIVSQKNSEEYTKDGTTNAQGGSPVDNNMSNTIAEDDTKNATNVKKEQTTNYDTGNTTTTTISSPGKVKRVTASVFVDGDLDRNTKDSLEQAVGNVIGYDATRGDSISVTGIDFDTTASDQAQANIDALNEEMAAEKRNKIILWSLLGAAVLAGIIIFVVLLRRKRNKDEELEEDEDRLLDVVVDDGDIPEETQKFAPINFDTPNEKSHIEEEIKEYAKKKPEQVAEIVKSWLSENER